jgi:hypothetical protein
MIHEHVGPEEYGQIQDAVCAFVVGMRERGLCEAFTLLVMLAVAMDCARELGLLEDALEVVAARAEGDGDEN